MVFAQKKYEPTWESIDSRPIPEWYQDAKFGIFIHWGVYSVPAWSPKGTYAEWYQYWLQQKTLWGNGKFTGNEIVDYHAKKYGADTPYYKLVDDFKAELFNPDEWAALLEKAGAKYVVLTSKHHEGFCLWPNETASKTWGFPWNSMVAGPKRDLIGELTTAVRKTSVKMGLYYSLYEWYNPLYKSDVNRYVAEHMHPQFKDLITRYHPSVIWSDGDWDQTVETWKSPELLAWVFNDSGSGDDVVINDRWGKGTRFHHGGFYSPEYDPAFESDRTWEECRGLGFSFGYNRQEDAVDYISPQTIILLLTDIVSRGGNLLLDIGPDASGKIPPIMQDRLLEVGKWLGVNGEAIYGTRKWTRSCQWSAGDQKYDKEGEHYAGAGFILKQTVNPEPGKAVKEIFFTRKGKTIYAILPVYPRESIEIKDFRPSQSARITLLGTGKPLNWARTKNGIRVEVPVLLPGETPCSWAWTLKIEDSEM
jgi:alpha-L-fucosidase